MNKTMILVLLLIFAVAVVLITPFIGMIDVPLGVLWGQEPAMSDGTVSNSTVAAEVFWNLRVPRVAVSFLAGAALAISGMVFQAMFRNPLATPFTLGVSSGSALGASICINLGLSFTVLGLPAISVFAFAGSLLSIALVYGLSRARRGFSSATMLLAGVAVSFFFSSMILFIQYISDFTQSFRMIRWVMGGLESVVGPRDVLNVLPFVVAGSLIVAYLTRELNLITTGEQMAASRGVEVQKTKIALFLCVSLMVGAVVAVCGPIGFVGLMAPHICRLLIGADHRYLTPATWLFGGAFLTLCDTLSRTVIAPAELPVGIITALLGGPFFLWLLVGRGGTCDP
jgi:iron complex transport system permease protein